tara:strand:+ start:122 stop:460 length:339 start_codon:yes stop_codon:yes gene_type:complete
MTEKVNKSKRITNELLLETYKPILMVKLSQSTTIRLGDTLEKFALDISEKSGYEVLTFPNEEETDIKIVSVCGSELEDISELRDYIYSKYKSPTLENIPFTSIKNIIKKRNE